MGNRVKRVKTEVSIPQITQAINNEWKHLFNTDPSKEQIAMILAQNSLETGNRKSMWNYNIGNITTNGNGEYDFFDDLVTDEQVQPNVWKKKNLKYRAYKSLEDGVRDYLKFLSSKKYAGAWEHILNPNPAAFSKSLKQSGYYTANEKPYTKIMVNLYNKYMNSPSSVDKSSVPQDNNSLDKILDNYLQIVDSSDKKMYNKILPHNNILIKINSTDFNNSVEFSRILCAALEEELMAKAYIYTNNESVEVECEISGPLYDCFATTQQLTKSITDAFKIATDKIGGIQIMTECVINKKSSYKEICFKSAEYQHRKFLLKFI